METTMAKVAKKDEETTEIVSVAQTAGEVELYDAGEDAGLGMEDISLDERRLPFLRVLDPKSPQCKPVNQGGLPGAKGGAILNTSTNQVYDGEAGGEFIPSYRDQKFVEYIKRNEDGSGGGFVGVHEPDEPMVGRLRAKHGKFGKLPMGVTPDGKALELVQSFYLYGTFYPANGDDSFRCIVGFASTQIKKYQGFIDLVDNIKYPARLANGEIGRVKPPLWAHRFRLTTTYESKGGFSWYGWVIRFAEETDDMPDRLKSRMSKNDERYIAAKDFYSLIKEGLVKPDYEKAASGEEETTGDEEGRWEH